MTSYDYNWFENIMISHWPDILEARKHLTFWTDDITVVRCRCKWINTSGNAVAVNNPELRDMELLEFFDLCQYQKNKGKIL